MFSPNAHDRYADKTPDAGRGYRGIGHDITAQKQSAELIHALAFFNTLTGRP